MRCLFLHCSNFNYILDHITPIGEQACQGESKIFENCLVVFVTSEINDGAATVAAATREIAKIAGKIAANDVVLNPFAHLSNNLAKPAIAMKLVKDLSLMLEEENVKTHCSPFGWYKKFKFDVLAHDSSQLYREF